MDRRPVGLAALCALGLVLSLSPGCRRIERAHDRAQLHNNQGVVYLQRREFDRALQEFKIALELSPRYADAHQNMGVLYEQTGDLVRAEESYKKSIEADHKFAQPHSGLCSVYIRTKRYDDAVSQGKKALKKDATLADAAYCAGLAYFRKNDLEEAAKMLRDASDIDANSYIAHNELGKVYLAQGKFEDAANRFRVATEVLPTYEEGWRNLSYSYLRMGDLTKAEQSVKAALGVNMQSLPAHKMLALVYMRRAKAEPIKALQYCQSAVSELRIVIGKIDRFDGEALGNLGLAERCMGAEERRTGRLDTSARWLSQSERTFRRAIEVDPEYCSAYFYLGELQQDELRDPGKGLASYEQALQCSEKTKTPLAPALFKLGSYYTETGDTKRGRDYLCRYLASTGSEKSEDAVRRARAVVASMGGCP